MGGIFFFFCRMFADVLGCSDISQLKQCALKKSVAEIILAQVKVKSAMMLSPFAPVVDGHFLTGEPAISGTLTSGLSTN